MTYDAYIICTSPRSGSTLLCRLLSQTGVAGHPASYFHEASVQSWRGELGLDDDPALSETDLLTDTFRAAIAKGSGETGMFGLRLQRHSFEFFTAKLALMHPGLASEKERIYAAFGRTAFIHLTREDKLGQAISYVKAQQSGLWHRASDGTELERLSPPSEPAYDAEQIRRQIGEFETFDLEWRRWFGREGIDPLRITYETLSRAPRETLGDVLGHLGLNRNAARRAAPDVAKLADRTSLEWAERYRSEGEVST